jgi:hypothetical protein
MANPHNQHFPSAIAIAQLQQGAFEQIASPVQAQVSNRSGSVLSPKLRHLQVPDIQMGTHSNGIAPPFLATSPNMVAAVQQSHQLMPMMWSPEAGPPSSFPMTFMQMNMSRLPPPPPPATSKSQIIPGNDLAARAVVIASMPAPVSGPDLVSVRSTSTIDSKQASIWSKGVKHRQIAAETSTSNFEPGMTGSEDASDDQDVKVKQSRERNREHARSTRLRKKVYVQKLKDMAQGIRAVQTEEIRERRISMQKLLEIQKLRRTVVKSVLQYHASNEQEPAKWSVLLEESFWLKQPVTPFRSFRRSEIDGVSWSRNGSKMLCFFLTSHAFNLFFLVVLATGLSNHSWYKGLDR